MRLEFSVEQKRPEQLPVHTTVRSGGIKAWRAGSLVNDCSSVIGSLHPVLPQERGIEERTREQSTHAKWRLGAELFHHQLLDGVVKDPIAPADRGFPRTAGELRQGTIGPAGAVRQPNSWCESFVICRGQALRYTWIAGEYHPRWEVSVVSCARCRRPAIPWGGAQGCGAGGGHPAGILGRILARPER